MIEAVERCPWCGSKITHSRFVQIQDAIRKDEQRKLAALEKAFDGERAKIAKQVELSKQEADKLRRKVGDIRIGRGPVIARGANISPRVFDLLVATAQEEGIPYQVEAAPRGTGTDANAMQLSRAGMATGLVSVPVRYMHTPCEVLSLADLENACRLGAGFARRVTGEMTWTL